MQNNSSLESILEQYLPALPVFNEFAAFAQDEWRMPPRSGSRSACAGEVDPPPTEAHGDDAFTLFGSLANLSSLTLAPRGTALWQATLLQFCSADGVGMEGIYDAEVGDSSANQRGVFFDTDDQVVANGYGPSAIGIGRRKLLPAFRCQSQPASLTFLHRLPLR